MFSIILLILSCVILFAGVYLFRVAKKEEKDEENVILCVFAGCIFLVIGMLLFCFSIASIKQDRVNSEHKQTYTLRLYYVNGMERVKTYVMPSSYTPQIRTNKGSYYLVDDRYDINYTDEQSGVLEKGVVSFDVISVKQE